MITVSVCVYIDICADMCTYIPLLCGLSRAFQLEWIHMVLFVHHTLLFCCGIDHVLFIPSAPLHLLFVHARVYTHTHTFW